MTPLREWGWRTWAAGAALLAGVLLLGERLWVTDAEAIGAELESLGAALEGGDAVAALAVFADDVDFDGLDRAGLAIALHAALAQHVPSRVRTEEVTVQVDGDGAASTVRWAVTGQVQHQAIPGVVDVTLRWRRTPEGWRITGLDTAKPFAWSSLVGGATETLGHRVRALARR